MSDSFLSKFIPMPLNWAIADENENEVAIITHDAPEGKLVWFARSEVLIGHSGLCSVLAGVTVKALAKSKHLMSVICYKAERLLNA